MAAAAAAPDYRRNRLSQLYEMPDMAVFSATERLKADEAAKKQVRMLYVE